MKFVEPDVAPVIRLTAERDEDGFWCLGVRDEGIGLEADATESIFEPFRRLHGANSFPGSGLGLSICRRVVNRHGGRIWVESKPGRGSHFRFTLRGAEAQS